MAAVTHDQTGERDDRLLRLAGIAVAAGAFSGLFGVGGGTAIVPLLILWLAYPEKLATGTSLVAITVIAAVAAIAHGIFGSVDPAKGLLLGAPAVVGVLAGTSIQQRMSDRAISYGFSGLLIAIAALFIVRG